MIHFYRRFETVQAITFDLDDTLYDNGPVIQRAEQEFMAYLGTQHSVFQEVSLEQFKQLRLTLQQQCPELLHDVTRSRWCAVNTLLQQQGYSEQQARVGADKALHHFSLWRSQVTISAETHQILQQLAMKYPLGVITNGNVELAACGLSDYFHFVLRAGPDGRLKPFPDLFLRATELLSLPGDRILHVGDSFATDVTGALNSGLLACWLTTDSQPPSVTSNDQQLPHIVISRLASLQALL